jgi:hypothetical protein
LFELVNPVVEDEMNQQLTHICIVCADESRKKQIYNASNISKHHTDMRLGTITIAVGLAGNALEPIVQPYLQA